MSGIKVIAHRGAMAYEPENSLAAFGKALAQGVHMIELDVRTTTDGTAIIMHDETVNRTTTGRGMVADMTLAEIQSLKLKNGEPVPILKDALDKLKGRCLVNVEIKDAGSISTSAEAVKGQAMMKDVIFSSFHGPWLVDLKLRYPEARVAFISDDKKLDCVRIARSLKAEAIHISSRITTRELLIKAQKEGLDVSIWPVNSAWKMKRFIAMGANGIITGKPDLLARVIAKLDSDKKRSL